MAIDPFRAKVSAPGGVALASSYWRPEGEATGLVVLAHGWGEHHRRYEELARAMNGRGLAVWGYDQRGHGDSGGRRGHVTRFDQLVEDLAWVTDHALTFVSPEVPLLLVGHSMGGLVVLRALQTQALSPAAACVSAPWLKTAATVPPWKLQLAGLLDRVMPWLPIPNRLDPTTRTRDAEMIRAVQKDRMVHGWMTSRFFREIGWAQGQVLAHDQPLKMPLLVIIPGDDLVVDADATRHFAEKDPGSPTEIIHVPAARHEPFHEVDRETRFDEVGRFFAKVLDAA